MINPSIFKAYDIRGIYPEEINEQNVRTITKAIYTYFSRVMDNNKLTIVLTHDARISSPSLYKVVKETLVAIGADIIDVGLANTPSMYYTVLKYNYDAGIQITASHNPKDYNGLKMVRRSGNSIIKIGKTTGMTDIVRIVNDDDFLMETGNGTVNPKYNILQQEVLDAIAFLKPQVKPFKIVADPANAVGALIIEEIAKHLPIELIKMNFELDGNFPNHQADPLQFKLLKSLQDKVVEEKADLGLAPDGDGDRIFFIDEKGQIVPATMITSILARKVLADHPHEKILVDVRYTRNVENVCKQYGVEPVLCPVGHALITQQLNKTQAYLAGESSGHFFFRSTGGGESAIYVILEILNEITTSGKTLSQLTEEVHSSYESGEYNFEFEDQAKIPLFIDTLRKEYIEARLITIDGVSIEYADWRCNIRSSNTEPLLRLNIESDSQELTDTKLKELSDRIIAFGGVAIE